MGFFYFSRFQKYGVNSRRTVNNSSLPTISIKLINSLIGGLKILKSAVGPSSPKAIPVFDNIPADAVKVVVKSKLSSERTKAVNINTIR